MIQLLRCSTTIHTLSMLGYLISVSFNALYAWDQDPRYNNSDFPMDWYPYGRQMTHDLLKFYERHLVAQLPI